MALNTTVTGFTDARRRCLARLARAAYISVSFPHNCMRYLKRGNVLMKNVKLWIANFGSPEPDEPNVIHEIERGDLLVRIGEYDDPCGDKGYTVELVGLNHEEKLWVGLGFIGAEDLQGSIELLQEALAFVNDKVTTPRERKLRADAPKWLSEPVALPRVTVGKKTYFIDVRLQELRNVDVPHDRIVFCGA